VTLERDIVPVEVVYTGRYGEMSERFDVARSDLVARQTNVPDWPLVEILEMWLERTGMKTLHRGAKWEIATQPFLTDTLHRGHREVFRVTRHDPPFPERAIR